MQARNRLALYEERLLCLWQRLVATLGIHTARVLLHRALWQTAQRHPAIALIRHDDCGLCFEALEMSSVTRPWEEVGGYAIGSQEEMEDALTDLSAEMVLLLTRLRGGEVGTAHEHRPPRFASGGSVRRLRYAWSPKARSAHRPYAVSVLSTHRPPNDTTTALRLAACRLWEPE